MGTGREWGEIQEIGREQRDEKEMRRRVVEERVKGQKILHCRGRS